MLYSIPSLSLFLLILTSHHHPQTHALPHTLIEHSNHCTTSVEVPADTLLNIYYEAPDMNLHQNEKYSLVITPSYDTGRGNRKVDRKHRHKHASAAKKNKRLVEPLKTPTGNVQYEAFGPITLNVCVRFRGASASNPIRFGLRVASGRDSAYYKEKAVDGHLTSLQVQLMKGVDDIEDMIKVSEFTRRVEQEFYDHNLSVYSASQWWPMIQTCVILGTGVTTILHMVSFFNKRVF